MEVSDRLAEVEEMLLRYEELKKIAACRMGHESQDYTFRAAGLAIQQGGVVRLLHSAMIPRIKAIDGAWYAIDEVTTAGDFGVIGNAKIHPLAFPDFSRECYGAARS